MSYGRYRDSLSDESSDAHLVRNGAIIVAAVIVAIVGIWAVFNIFRTVDNGRVGILTSYGKVVGKPHSPGGVFKLPWQKLHEMDIQVQKEQADAAAATRDLQDVNATLALNYSLSPDQALTVYRTIGTHYKERIVDPALQETFKATTARYNAADLIGKRQEVSSAVTDALRARLQPYGINVAQINIVNFTFSRAFSDAVEARQVAEQAALTADANLRKAKLDAKTQQTLNATLTKQLLTQKFLDKWDGHLPQTMTGGDLSLLLPAQR